jgi:hypothetical protein
MTKDQKALILFQLENIIDLGQDITPEKQMFLINKVKDYVESITTGKKNKDVPNA